MQTAEQLIAALRLKPLPLEGGYYLESYRADEVLPAAVLPPRYQGDRATATAIYYLLTPDTFSALHRLKSDEVYHFYAGSPVQMLQLWPDGSGRIVILGSDILAGQMPQLLVPRGVWQGSLLLPGGEFALLGCTVAPGFDFQDWEGGERQSLLAQYPAHADLIRRLTHG